MPNVRKVGVYKPKVVAGGHQIRWRIYEVDSTKPIEKSRTFKGTGSKSRIDAFYKRLLNAEAGVVENGQRWGFTSEHEPVLRSMTASSVTDDTIWTLACSYRTHTWRNMSGNGRKSTYEGLSQMVQFLVTDDVPDETLGYLRLVAFRGPMEPTDDEIRRLVKDAGGTLRYAYRVRYEYTAQELIDGRDWLVKHSLRSVDITRDKLRGLTAYMGTGRKANTERRRWGTAKAVLRWAQSETENGVARFPQIELDNLCARGVEKPKLDVVAAVPTLDEMWQFAWAIGLAVGPSWCALPTTMGGAGLRLGEAADLRRRSCIEHPETGGMWLKVHSNYTNVGKAWTNTGETGEIRGTKAKGPEGNRIGRTTYLPPAEAAILRAHLELFVAADLDALVFTGKRGGRVSHNITVEWDAATSVVFPSPHRLHGELNRHAFRHLACTRWLRGGIPLTTAARWGGWKSVAVMVEFYDSVLPNDDETAAALIALNSPVATPNAARPDDDTATRRSAA